MNNFYLKYLKYKKKYLVLRNQLGGAYIATFRELNDTIIKNKNNLKPEENPDDAKTLKLIEKIMAFNKALNNDFSISKDISKDKIKIENSIKNLKGKIEEYNDVYEPKLSVPEFLNKSIDEIIILVNENNSKNQKLSNHSQQRISDNEKQKKIKEREILRDKEGNKELTEAYRKEVADRASKKFKEDKIKEQISKDKLENETNHKKESLERLEKERLERLEKERLERLE